MATALILGCELVFICIHAHMGLNPVRQHCDIAQGNNNKVG